MQYSFTIHIKGVFPFVSFLWAHFLVCVHGFDFYCVKLWLIPLKINITATAPESGRPRDFSL